MLSRSMLGFHSLFVSRFKILAYHGVPKSGPSLYEVDLGTFRAHMAVLHDEGYRVQHLTTAIDEARSGRVSERGVCITFDDADHTVIENAAPILANYGYAATVFVPTGLVGRTVEGISESPNRIMGWGELAKLLRCGFEVGSHTVTHANLLTVSAGSAKFEIEQSHKDLVEHFGEMPYCFAYPYGLLDKRIKDAVAAASYFGAVCFGSILSNSHTTDPFLLKREKILRTTSEKEFRRLIDTRNDCSRAIGYYLRKVAPVLSVGVADAADGKAQ